MGSLGRKALADAERNVAKAQAKDQIKARAKLARWVDGTLRFLSDPPLLVPVDELFGHVDADGAIRRQMALMQTLPLGHSPAHGPYGEARPRTRPALSASSTPSRW